MVGVKNLPKTKTKNEKRKTTTKHNTSVQPLRNEKKLQKTGKYLRKVFKNLSEKKHTWKYVMKKKNKIRRSQRRRVQCKYIFMAFFNINTHIYYSFKKWKEKEIDREKRSQPRDKCKPERFGCRATFSLLFRAIHNVCQFWRFFNNKRALFYFYLYYSCAFTKMYVRTRYISQIMHSTVRNFTQTEYRYERFVNG